MRQTSSGRQQQRAPGTARGSTELASSGNAAAGLDVGDQERSAHLAGKFGADHPRDERAPSQGTLVA
ncbi:MAG: hypothetical protein U1E61_15725 [Bradyrhizobium sp.]